MSRRSIHSLLAASLACAAAFAVLASRAHVAHA
jgi:hypothetical protein